MRQKKPKSLTDVDVPFPKNLEFEWINGLKSTLAQGERGAVIRLTDGIGNTILLDRSDAVSLLKILAEVFA